jgi:hypothetical protein
MRALRYVVQKKQAVKKITHTILLYRNKTSEDDRSLVFSADLSVNREYYAQA